MNATEALARIQRLGVPAVTTSDVAALLDLSTGAASHTLRRLARARLVGSLRRGLWSVSDRVDPLAMAEYITAPYPSYVSLQTALYLRGMIMQIPATIYLVSLARSARVTTPIATYSLHHVAPEIFDGFEVQPKSGIKLAFAEKALVDLLYLSGTRTRLFSSLPELELPRGFRTARARAWVKRIPAPRLRVLVEQRLKEVLERARSGGG